MRIAESPFSASRGVDRGNPNRGQLAALIEQVLNTGAPDKFRINEHLDPENRFVSLFFDDSHLCNKICVGSGTTRGPIIGRN